MNPDDPTAPVPPPQAASMSDSAVENMLAAGGVPPAKTADWTPPAPEEIQRLLPDYEVQSLVGRGGMGAVYRGVQRSLERPVAIKILPPEMAGSDPQFAARFKQEARAMARLSHPNIVPVHEFGQTPDGLLYFIMEFIDGTDLAHIIRSEGHLSPRKAAAIISQVCDALEFAHEAGIVHRDIKPSNVMVDRRGQVKVADFGLAKSLEAKSLVTTAATMSGTVMGTLAYMAPEQAQGRKVDHRADIYSLGAMFYEMLTGEPPHGAIEPPSHQHIEVDVRLDQIVLKALARDPDRRYQHASEVKTDVTRVTDGPAVVKAEGKGRRIALAALIAASLAAGAFFALREWSAHSVVRSGSEATANTTAQGTVRTTLTETKDAPFTNTLGMKFVPVPGSSILMCIHETRRKDYSAFAVQNPETNETWKKVDKDGVPVNDGDDQPVVMVSWNDARAFCEWISKREGRIYRLPTDHEWSLAVGIGGEENPDSAPADLDALLPGVFPWGTDWPPPPGSGNYGDRVFIDAFPPGRTIEGAGYGTNDYADGHAVTAPVMSFTANKFGLFDLSGNVWEWCEDWRDATQKHRVTRGGSWGNGDKTHLYSARRHRYTPGARSMIGGFRCVLEIAPTVPAAFQKLRPDVKVEGIGVPKEAKAK